MVAVITLKILLTVLSNLTSLYIYIYIYIYKQIECTYICIQNCDRILENLPFGHKQTFEKTQLEIFTIF